MNDTALRAVIYCRVSGVKQIDGSSLQTQEQICTEYVQKHHHVVVEKFIEKGESAKTANRTELQRLMKYCTNKKNKINLVVFYKVDRFARYRLDYDTLCHVLRSKGIQVQSATEPILNTPAGRFMEGMLAAQSQFDNEVRAERCTDGMKAAVAEGRYIWLAPIGYRNTLINKKSNIIQSDKASLVREMFEEVAKGFLPADTVRRMMHSKGLCGKNNQPLARSPFHRMLRNKLYAGYITAFDGMQKGSFEPIVSEELFNRVQHVLNKKKSLNIEYKWDSEDFPLRRFIKHPSGNTLRGAWARNRYKTKYPFYRFIGIKGANYRRDFVEKLFVDLLNSVQLSNKDTKRVIEFIDQAYKKTSKGKLESSEDLQKTLNELRKKQELLIDKNLRGIIPDELAQRQLKALSNEEVDIQANLYSQKPNMLNVDDVFGYANEFLQNLGNLWLKASLRVKLDLQKFIFPQGLIFDGLKLRTPEIAIIFKVKDYFFDTKSLDVNKRFEIANLCMVQLEHIYKIMHEKNRIPDDYS